MHYPRIALLVLLAVIALTACATSPSPIVFGSRENPQSTFPLDEGKEIAWTVFLPEPVGGATEATSVNLVISPSGTDTELFGYRQFITDPDMTTLTNEMPIGRFIQEPGVYVMRYVTVEGEVLAAGEFELVAD